MITATRWNVSENTHKHESNILLAKIKGQYVNIKNKMINRM